MFKIDESTSLSQFLAHYSFTTIDKEDTGFQIKGGIKVMPSQDNDHSGTAYLVTSSKQMLKLSTPILIQVKKLTVVGRHRLVDNPSV